MAPHVLAPGGWLLIEHHYNQANDVARLLKTAGLIDLDAAMDLEGKLRFAIARAPGES
jgi:release factor glutamine methyltransferase